MKLCKILVAGTCALVSCGLLAEGDELSKRLTFHASFDNGFVADFSKGDPKPAEMEAVASCDGKRGSAAKFGEAKSALSYSMKGVVPESGPWTLCFWAKPAALPSVARQTMTLFRIGRGGWKDGDVFANINAWGKFSFSCFDSKGEYKNLETASSIFKPGRWVHLAFVVDGAEKRLFVNGVEVRCEKNDKSDIPCGPENFLRLGCMMKGSSAFEGELDEVALYAAALTQEQVKEVMDLKSEKAAKPVSTFFASFNGDALASSHGKFLPPASLAKVEFVKSGDAKGAQLMRYGYDSKSVLSYANVEGALGAACVSFSATPKWAGDDGELHAFVEAKSKDGEAGWSVVKTKSGKLRFEVLSNGEAFAVEKDAKSWKPDEPHEILATCDQAGGALTLAVDGQEAAKGAFPKSSPKEKGARASLCVGDLASSDVYAKTQANAVIKDLMLCDKALSPQEVQAERKVQRELDADDKDGLPFEEKAPNAKEASQWDLAGAFAANTPSRKEVCLNALWRFQLVEPRQKPTNDNWRYLAVPGRYSGDANDISDHQFLVRDAAIKPLPPDFKWNGKSLYDYRISWFERAFALDESWKGFDVSLRFERLSPSESATVYVNGKEAGKLDSSCDQELVIPASELRFGSLNFLALRVEDVGGYWAWRGIMGDVWLVGRPALRVESPAVATSVGKRKLVVKAELVNNSKKDAELKLRCEVAGKNAPQAFESSLVALKPGERKLVEISKSWKDAELWDFENPKLYEATLSALDADDRKVDQAQPFKFGFREFAIDGGDYLLNGKKVHLVTLDCWMNNTVDYEWCKRFARILKSIGFNSFRANFGDEKDVRAENIVKACDEEGVLVFMNAHGVDKGSYSSWNDPATRAQVEKDLASIVKKWRLHPSVVMWYLSSNQLGYAWDYHPLKQADGYLPSFQKDFSEACLDAAKLLDKYDGTRPYFMQAGGDYGPVHTSNGYFCWWPLAERMEWPEEWSKRKLKPLHLIETSFPYWGSWFGMDLESSQEKPYFLPENAARSLGPEAYELVGKEEMKFLDDPKKHSDLRDEVLSQELRGIPLAMKVKEKMLTDSVLAWRGAGVSGFCPFYEIRYAYLRKCKELSRHAAQAVRVDVADFRTPGWKPDILKSAPALDMDETRPTSYLKTLENAFRPATVFIGGDAKRPTGEDHSFRAGEKCVKSLVALNDTLSDKEFKLSWRLLDASGATLESGAFDFELAPGERAKKKISLRIPETKRIETLKLVVDAASPAGIEVAPFEIQAYPADRESLEGLKGLALYDEKGFTKELLRDEGASFDNFAKLKSLNGVKLAIVGRESLSAKFFEQAKKLGLREAVLAGDTNLLVCEQRSLAPFGLETHEVFERNVFVRGAKGAELFKGLPKAAFSWWNGDGELAPGYQAPDPASEGAMKSPFWHWSNRNMVCSYPVRRPDCGGCETLLTTGMDLLYSPLLEFKQGRGKIVFCQLETAGRTKADPAAETIFGRVVEEALKAPSVESHALATLGEKAELFAKRLGFETRRLEKPDEAGTPTTLLVSLSGEALAKSLPELERRAKQGGTIVFAPLSKSDLESLLKLKAAETEIRRLAVAKEGEEAFGCLDARDLFFRSPLKAETISGAGLSPLLEPAVAAEERIGQGRFILCQLDPAFFDAKLAEEMKTGAGSSNAFAWRLLDERALQVWTALLDSAGARSDSALAQRLAAPLVESSVELSGVWKFSFDPKNEGEAAGWSAPSFDDSKWIDFKLPGLWGKTLNLPQEKLGFGWFRREVAIPESLAGRDLTFVAKSGVDDCDWVYVDGVLIGRTGEETTGYWQAPRAYKIPASLTAGKKSVEIAIRVLNLRNDAGVNNGDFKLKPDAGEADPYPYSRQERATYETERHVRW